MIRSINEVTGLASSMQALSGRLSVGLEHSLLDVQVELAQAQGGHDSSVQCITVDHQYLYSADWHGNIKVHCCTTLCIWFASSCLMTSGGHSASCSSQKHATT